MNKKLMLVLVGVLILTSFVLAKENVGAASIKTTTVKGTISITGIQQWPASFIYNVSLCYNGKCYPNKTTLMQFAKKVFLSSNKYPFNFSRVPLNTQVTLKIGGQFSINNSFSEDFNYVFSSTKTQDLGNFLIDFSNQSVTR